MKKISATVIAGIFICLSTSAFGQQSPAAKPSVIEPYRLTITYSKTTNLVFPYAIKSVDRGSKDVLAQKAKGIENILQIKAGRKGFEETNLTVITGDGRLYSYILNYSENPSVLNILFAASDKKASNISFSQSTANEAELKALSKKIAIKKRSIRGKKDRKYGIKLQLEGLYVKEDVLYYQVSLLNKTYLNYDIGQFRFFIRDQKKAKRTASQEREIIPLFFHNDTATVKVKGQSGQMFVFALPKFTIPDKKYLAIQVMEENGGTHLELKVGNSIIIKSKPLTH